MPFFVLDRFEITVEFSVCDGVFVLLCFLFVCSYVVIDECRVEYVRSLGAS